MCANMIAINKVFPNIRNIGLCHSVQGTAEMLAEDLQENINNISYQCAGINHMAFFQKFEKPVTSIPPRLHTVSCTNILVHTTS